MKVVDAIDENDEAAVVDVAQPVFRIGVMAGKTQPEHVDRYALFEERKVSGLAGEGMASIAADGECGRNLDGAIGCTGHNACGDAIGLNQAGCFPAHAKREGGKFRPFGGEEGQEIPLRHQGDVLRVGWKMGKVGHRDVEVTEPAGHMRNLGVADGKQLIQKTKLVKKLERRGMNGIAAKVAKEVLVFFEDRNGDAFPGEQKAQHDSGGAAADDAARGLCGGCYLSRP